MRDVCIEYSQQTEDKPLTRSCGFNVDIGDIIQEMSSQLTETQTPQQLQQNSWTVQKQVIQRKFLEVCVPGFHEFSNTFYENYILYGGLFHFTQASNNRFIGLYWKLSNYKHSTFIACNGSFCLI